jgi:CubicO group peptidase (beta-lactamase class C family)
MKKLWIVAALLAAWPFLACAAPDDDRPPPGTLAELREAVETVRVEHDVPAVGIALVGPDGPLWVDALGKADLGDDVDADADTMFRIGSVSKMFVALAVLQLVEQGRLSLDDRVADLAPEIEFDNRWEASDPVRVVHLLEHTTGWDDLHLPEYAHNDPTPATLREGLDFHPHSRVSRWKPGTRMAYCNAGPPVAAYIVEKITGQPFEDYVRDHFFEPLGMETMTYRLSEAYAERGATLYANGGRPQDYWHIIMRPSGSINASPRDMARLVRFFLERGRANGRPLVSEASLRRMERAVSSVGARAGLDVGYGLHNYASRHEHWTWRGHSGGVNGGLTEFAYLPEAGAGYVVMINSDSGAALREISKLVRGFETRELTPPEREPAPGLTDENRALAGYYQPINPRQAMAYFVERIADVQRIEAEDDRLVRRAVLGGEPAAYFPVDAARYRHAESGRIEMVRAEDPLAGPVVHAGTTVLQPVSGLRVFTQFTVVGLWASMALGAILFFPVWGVRRLLGRVPPGAAVRVRTWPLLAALCVLAFLGLFAIGFTDPFRLLGGPTPVSVGILLATIGYALFTLLGVHCAWAARRRPINRVAYWHAAAASGLNLVVLVYLLANGVIGMMTWA